MHGRVNPSLVREVAAILNPRSTHEELAPTGQLLVAARMLSNAAADEMSTTTVVGVLTNYDIDEFRSLVESIAEEFGLRATVRLTAGSFSVRFSREYEDGVDKSG
jgi:hypothetical protein